MRLQTIAVKFYCPHSPAYLLILCHTGLLSTQAADKYENPTPWSYQRLQRPAIPATKDSIWPKDDLDRVILARLEKENLRPIGDALHLHATVLPHLGINHERLTCRYSGRNSRLTDVHGEVAKDFLA